MSWQHYRGYDTQLSHLNFQPADGISVLLDLGRGWDVKTSMRESSLPLLLGDSYEPLAAQGL